MPTIVGIFDDQESAEEAVNALDGLELDADSIRVLSRSGAERSTSPFGGLARAFTAGDSKVEDSLLAMGVDRDAAAFYDEELGPEGVLVVADVGNDQADAVRAALRAAGGTVRT